MPNDNRGSQNGDNSLNVGIGDFRGANVNIGTPDRPTFTGEDMKVVRHPAVGGKSLKSGSISAFGIVTGVASLIGLYFTLFQPFPSAKYSSWSALFMFSFAVAIVTYTLSAVLKRRKFESFLFGCYLECGDRGGIYLSRFTATCPWCNSKMQLRNVGPKEGPRDNYFICERNPRHHTIDLDPTILEGIEE